DGEMNTGEAVRRLPKVVRRKHLAPATERTDCAWLRRYCDFLKRLPLRLPSEHKLERFLTVLTQEGVAASIKRQALFLPLSESEISPPPPPFRAKRPKFIFPAPHSDIAV
ncbi:MAG: phage integrase N-terminal SAM-like domain-containing protein, partial [Verrucomicrobiota bacterium]